MNADTSPDNSPDTPPDTSRDTPLDTPLETAARASFEAPLVVISGTAALTHWGVIRALGADAVKFLQGQLTNDVAKLSATEARLAGFCSAKGRLQASFVVWKDVSEDVLLACSASVLPAVLKRLSMFVMRAQCKLSDATSEVPLHGLAGDAAMALAGGLSNWQTRSLGGSTVIRVPDAAGLSRVIVAGPDVPPSSTSSALSLDTWRWLDVQSGVPTIEVGTVEQFVPQMLNYELVGGVDFQKGCYPGQEIVARSQYRGTIKRRMFLFDVDVDFDVDLDVDRDVDLPAASARHSAPVPGQEVFHSGDPGQPAGMVVNAAPAPDGNSFSVLAEVKIAAVEDGSLHLGSPAGDVLVRRELPYPLPLESTESA